MKAVALLTCRELPEPDPDEEPLLEALSAAGLRAELLPWMSCHVHIIRMEIRSYVRCCQTVDAANMIDVPMC